MILSIVGKAQDILAADNRTVQPLSVPASENITINIAAQHHDGAVFDLSNAILLFSVRRVSGGDAVISREATYVSQVGGTAYFPLGASDTTNLRGDYVYDVFLIQTIAGVITRWQIVPESKFFVQNADQFPGQAITVPASQQPLMQGPAGPPGPDGPPGPPGPPGAGAWNITPIQTVGDSYSASANDYVRVNATSGLTTVVLPDATGQAGKHVAVKDVGGASSSNSIKITTQLGQTIDVTLGGFQFLNTFSGGLDYCVVIFVSDGANWLIESVYVGRGAV